MEVDDDDPRSGPCPCEVVSGYRSPLMARTLTTLVDGLAFGEGPRWHDGSLWFSDMHGHKVHRVSLDGTLETIVEVPTQPSGLGWDTQGRLLLVSMVDRKLKRLDGDQLVEVADLSPFATWHCNDMVVDSAGRAYVGNFGFDIYGGNVNPVPAVLVLVDADGSIRVVADELLFPNGTVITPDGGTLIVGGELRRTVHGLRCAARRVAHQPSHLGAAVGQRSRRDLPRCRRCDLVRVPDQQRGRPRSGRR